MQVILIFNHLAKTIPTQVVTGLIVGLVVGLVGFFALVGGLIAAIVIAKSKSARANKPIGRATAISRAPQDAL